MFKLNMSEKWKAVLTPKSLPKATPSRKDNGKPSAYRVEMQPILHDFHPKIKKVPVWSYNRTAPGMVIEAAVGTPVEITWFNKLQGQNLEGLLQDITSPYMRQGMEEDHMLTLSHNQVHLHGARVPWTSDGFPEHVYHPGEGRIFRYPNNQAAATLWYHDHTMDVTRLNVYAGLFGVYLLRHPDEEELLPLNDLEIPLILQDKSFSKNIQNGKTSYKLLYEQVINISPGQDSSITPEFIGNHPVVNGKIWPRLTLKPRIYRFRLVNGANTRFFNLSFLSKINPNTIIPFHVIGTDGGFLEKPAPTKTLLLAPGERADVLVDLRTIQSGDELILRNDAPIPYSGDPNDEQYTAPDYLPLDSTDPCAELLKIVVSGQADASDDKFDPTKPTFKLPKHDDPLATAVPTVPTSTSQWAEINAAIDTVPLSVLEHDIVTAPSNIAFKLRRFVLEEHQLAMRTSPLVLSPTVLVNGKSWQDADPVQIKKDTIEVWEFVNVTPDTHPMHLHLVQFQTICRARLTVIADPSRQTADLPEPRTATAYDTATFPNPELGLYEQAWKDTVRCNPDQSTRIIAKFDGYIGEYVYHCHILEHEDMGMMYKMNVDA
jgi:spore coat protein A, manganese oxidase